MYATDGIDLGAELMQLHAELRSDQGPKGIPSLDDIDIGEPPPWLQEDQEPGRGSRGTASTVEPEAGAELVDEGPSWPKFSERALHPGLIQAFVACATENSEADPAAVLAGVLVRLSVEVGRGPFLMVGDDRQHCNILAAVVGPSGNGRKGTSLKPVQRVFALLTDEHYQAARWVPGPLSTGEGLIWAVRDEVQSWERGKRGEPGQWVITDPGIIDKRLFVATEELASAFAVMARDGNTLSAILRQIFETGELDVLTKTNRAKATGAHIGVLGHITLYELGELLKENEIHNGLVNRFLWFCSKRQKVLPFPKPISDDDLTWFQNEIRGVSRFAQAVGEMTLGDDARELWAAIYPELSQPQDGFLAVVLERGPVMVLRLSMIHALCDRSSVIHSGHIETALAVWEYCQQSARYIFDEWRRPDPLTDRILAALGTGPKSTTEISRALHHNTTGLCGSLRRLIERGAIESETVKTEGRGRKRVIYRLRDSTKKNEKNEKNEIIPNYLITLNKPYGIIS